MRDRKLGKEFDVIKGNKKIHKEYRLNLPCNTVEVLDTESFYVDNLYLKHHRFSYTDITLEKNNIEKYEAVESLLKYFQGLTLNNQGKKVNGELLDQLHKRTERLVNLYSENIVKVYYTPRDKLMIGVGGESPYGNLQLMSFHPLYGVPYIPASAIKGMLRYYCENYYETNDMVMIDKHYETNDMTIIDKLFGSENVSENSDVQDKTDNQGAAGELIFFDTFPFQFDLGFDVQTVHYSEYYQNNGETPPTDDQNPKPLLFPYMKSPHNVNKCKHKEMFCFNIAFRKQKMYNTYSVYLRNALERMLQNYGMGAKTAYGYGLAR